MNGIAPKGTDEVVWTWDFVKDLATELNNAVLTADIWTRDMHEMALAPGHLTASVCMIWICTSVLKVCYLGAGH